MDELNGLNLDPRLLATAARHLGQNPAYPAHQTGYPTRPVAPVASPVAMPGAPGPGGYMRYREMTIDEMLLENRVVFLVGEINHVSAANVYMKMLYLQSVKRDSDINLYINSPGGSVVDTLAVYADDHFLTPHLYAARHAYNSMDAARFTPMDLAVLDQIDILEPASIEHSP